MHDYKVLVQEFNTILSHINQSLTQDSITDIEELVNVGEWSLALDTLCENLHEANLSITQESYELIQKLASTMSMEDVTWEKLKQQVY
jgi:hypothetical protein